jgi:hypothetical protein
MIDDKKRGRFIECRGCPTVECTCFTELEDELLEKLLFARRESMTQHRKLNALIEALEKIEDPRKRDHKEPDIYTELGCVMNIATEALKAFEEK